MTNQSVTTLFIILAIMSATFFVHQAEKLHQVESQPSINLKQIKGSINSFEQSAANYQNAVDVKNGSDLVRGALDLLLSPFSSVINLFLDSVTDVENEAEQTIQTASTILHQYKNIIGQLEQTQQQQTQQIISLRNMGLIFCLFSLSSALFAKTPKFDKTPEIISTTLTPSPIKKAFFLSIIGGIVSCIPHYSGLFFQLVLPSLLIAFFIDQREFQKEQTTWQKRALKTIVYSLLITAIIYGLYTWQGMLVEYAVSGFLFGLFIASAVQHTLTTRQFFLIAFIFSIARLIATICAVEAGSELIILEGLIGIIGTLWVIQTHASWVRLVKFDIFLSWFVIYCFTAYLFGNYFQAGVERAILPYLVISLSGGTILAYHLSRTRTEINSLFHLSSKEKFQHKLVREEE